MRHLVALPRGAFIQELSMVLSRVEQRENQNIPTLCAELSSVHRLKAPRSSVSGWIRYNSSPREVDGRPICYSVVSVPISLYWCFV